MAMKTRFIRVTEETTETKLYAFKSFMRNEDATDHGFIISITALTIILRVPGS